MSVEIGGAYANHTEVTWPDEVLVAEARTMRLDMLDLDHGPHYREEVNRRLGHLVFEYWARRHIDGKEMEVA